MEANNKVSCELISDPHDPLIDKVEKTYNDSFPVEERRDFSLIRKLMGGNDAFHMYALCRDDQYAGFITTWNLGKFTYVEHFAVDESARNGGIGRKALETLLSGIACPVVLEVELPENELAKRRIGFYERIGFVLDNHTYFQPAYRVGEKPIPMLLMYCGDLDLHNAFNEVKDAIYKNVYGIKN